MENINLIDTFAEFKELKNIDRVTMMSVLEDAFRSVLIRQYETDENFDVIINIDFAGWKNRLYGIRFRSMFPPGLLPLTEK